jgi:hypothetical protein
MERVCAYLGVDFDYAFFSEMDLDIGLIDDPGQWALRIAEAMGADEYANPPGGGTLFDELAFAASGVKLTIRHLPPLEYTCGNYDFVPNLSIIDVMMWNQPKVIKAHLDEYKGVM